MVTPQHTSCAPTFYELVQAQTRARLGREMHETHVPGSGADVEPVHATERNGSPGETTDWGEEGEQLGPDVRAMLACGLPLEFV